MKVRKDEVRKDEGVEGQGPDPYLALVRILDSTFNALEALKDFKQKKVQSLCILKDHSDCCVDNEGGPGGGDWG
jgi:hypothetical protein